MGAVALAGGGSDAGAGRVRVLSPPPTRAQTVVLAAYRQRLDRVAALVHEYGVGLAAHAAQLRLCEPTSRDDAAVADQLSASLRAAHAAVQVVAESPGRGDAAALLAVQPALKLDQLAGPKAALEFIAGGSECMWTWMLARAGLSFSRPPRCV